MRKKEKNIEITFFAFVKNTQTKQLIKKNTKLPSKLLLYLFDVFDEFLNTKFDC